MLHPTRTLEWVEERNWFFRLSRYADFLRARLREQPEFLQPESRRNEMLALLDQGLEDVSASRSRFAWGVPFPAPLSTGETQTTYVWFDALPNYLTATGFPDGALATSAGPRSCTSSARTSRDSTRSSGRRCCRRPGCRCPSACGRTASCCSAASGSASRPACKLDLDEAIDRFGADAFRYFLLREVPFDADGSFSWERFEERYNADLANAWGNLASRVDLDGRALLRRRSCPAARRTDRGRRATPPSSREYHAAMDGTRGFLLHEALRHRLAERRARQRVRRPAGAVEAREGSGAARGARDDARRRSCVSSRVTRCSSRRSCPTRRRSSGRSSAHRGALANQRFDTLPTLDATGWRVQKGESLFPKEKPAA